MLTSEFFLKCFVGFHELNDGEFVIRQWFEFEFGFDVREPGAHGLHGLGKFLRLEGERLQNMYSPSQISTCDIYCSQQKISSILLM